MKKAIIAVVIIIVVAFGVYIFMNSRTPEVSADCSTGVVTITYTAEERLSPNCVKVKSGNTITWMNQSGKDLEIGANPHPIHIGKKEVSDGKFVETITPNISTTTKLTKKGIFG